MLFKFFDRKLQVEPLRWQINFHLKMKTFLIKNEELCKPVRIKKLKKRKKHSTFIDNIWVCNFSDMKLINKLDKGIRFLLSVIDRAWAIISKDKNGITITNAFLKIFKKSQSKENVGK